MLSKIKKPLTSPFSKRTKYIREYNNILKLYQKVEDIKSDLKKSNSLNNKIIEDLSIKTEILKNNLNDLCKLIEVDNVIINDSDYITEDYIGIKGTKTQIFSANRYLEVSNIKIHEFIEGEVFLYSYFKCSFNEMNLISHQIINMNIGNFRIKLNERLYEKIQRNFDYFFKNSEYFEFFKDYIFTKVSHVGPDTFKTLQKYYLSYKILSFLKTNKRYRNDFKKYIIKISEYNVINLFKALIEYEDFGEFDIIN